MKVITLDALQSDFQEILFIGVKLCTDILLTHHCIFQVLNLDEDENWCKAEQKGKSGWVPKSYIEIKEVE